MMQAILYDIAVGLLVFAIFAVLATRGTTHDFPSVRNDRRRS